ncbi:MAG: hypothetical protein DRP84_07945 [Spirochaetes bacterium]|nr:MAG: hypothetical protein DRP84_07945 [Spirochaetota bacterium]
MLKVRCCNCKNKNYIPAFRDIVICSKCGFAYVPLIFSDEEIKKYWQKSRYSNHQKRLTWYCKRISVFKHISKFIENRKTLDIGTGIGMLPAILRNKGVEAYGLDLSLDAIEFGRKFFNLNDNILFCSDIKNIEEIFDCITMVNSAIFFDFDELLCIINRLLSKDGRLIIRDINYTYEKLISCIRKDKFTGKQSFPGGYRWIIKCDALKKALKERGFTKIIIKSSPIFEDTFGKKIFGKVYYLLSEFLRIITLSKLIITPAVLVIADK